MAGSRSEAMTEGLERVWARWVVPVRPQSLSLRYRAASSLYTREPLGARVGGGVPDTPDNLTLP